MLEPIGKHIRLVDERNRRASNPPLLGVSIEKMFMPSVANTIGSNMANYKVVKKGQFACSLMQVRRDKKMPVALLRDYEEAIVSPAYPVFEIIDEDQLLPEYLMMWMLRPEFDREACFYAVGGVRGSLEWDDLCNIRLPVPTIEKQREIVKEYKTVVNRIRLNERLNEKLEETAQAIYKQWFVEFEFPMANEYAESIGKPELAGQPYKSSGGEMVYNEVLEQEIPKGWTNGTVHDLGAVVGGATPSTEEPKYWADEGISWISPKDLSRTGYKFIEHGKKHITVEGFKASSTVMLPPGSVLFSSRAPIGLLAINVEEVCTNQGFKSVIPKTEYGSAYVYFYLQNDTQNICNQVSGSTFDEISGKALKEHVCIIPRSSVCSEFSCVCKGLFQSQRDLEWEHRLNNQLLALLHSSLATDRAV